MPLPRAGHPTARAVKASAPLKTAARRPLVVVVAATPNYLRQASQNLGKYPAGRCARILPPRVNSRRFPILRKSAVPVIWMTRVVSPVIFSPSTLPLSPSPVRSLPVHLPSCPRLGFSPNEAWRAWQRSRFGSAFEREASGRDAAFRSKKPVAWFGSCARANGWTKKSDVELVEALD